MPNAKKTPPLFSTLGLFESAIVFDCCQSAASILRFKRQREIRNEQQYSTSRHKHSETGNRSPPHCAHLGHFSTLRTCQFGAVCLFCFISKGNFTADGRKLSLSHGGFPLERRLKNRWKSVVNCSICPRTKGCTRARVVIVWVLIGCE